jgi:colanic acid biosynthesis glycosyl transferase WcaI
MNGGRTGSVVFLNRYYWPQQAATGQALTDLAEDLAIRGWVVTVITSCTPYSGRVCSLARRETRNGVQIIRVPSSAFENRWVVGRAASYLQYFIGMAMALLRLSRPDVVVAMTDPPLLILPALLLARLRRARAVCWVQDVIPQKAARLGVVRHGGLAYRALEALTGFVHRTCDALVAPGERIADALLGAGASAARVSCIRNWADVDGIRPVPQERNPFRRDHGLDDAFVVLYSGRARGSHDFSAVMDTAWLLRERTDVVFLFIGGGEKLPHLAAQAWMLGLDSVRFMDPVPGDQLGYALSAADVALVTEDPAHAGLRVPSKTYRILASGRPLLFIGSEQSEVAHIVATHECGLVIAPGDAETLAAAILHLRKSPREGAAMGARGRMAAVNLYDRRIGTHHWNDLLHQVTKGVPSDTVGRFTGETSTLARGITPESGAASPASGLVRQRDALTPTSSTQPRRERPGARTRH